jgi:LacI family transcriptional regulator
MGRDDYPTPKVALLVETSLGYGRRFLRGVVRYARLHGPWGFYINPSDLRQLLPRMEEWGGTGIIARIETRQVERAVLATGLPTIALDLTNAQLAPGSPLAGLSEVRPDSPAAGALAAEHLLDRGFKHFAFVGSWGDFPWSIDRGAGFAARLKAAGVACEQFPMPQRPADRQWGREQRILAAWLRSLPRPLGVLACDDDRGRQVCEACHTAGLSVPDEVAVVGVDNDDLLCELADPPLSSVALDSEQAGWEAAALLDRMMKGEKVKRQRILVAPTGVVVRRSSDTRTTSDLTVTQAVRFIHDNAPRGIGVDDVVAAVGGSRRALELRFRKTLGRPVNAEIQRVKVERAKRLLTETDLSIERIAAASGFASSGYLIRLFKRDTGLAPSSYRRETKGAATRFG